MKMPIQSGMASLLSSMGVNIPEMLEKFELMTKYVASVDKRLAAIEATQQRLEAILKAVIIKDESTTENILNGNNGDSTSGGYGDTGTR